MKKKRLLLSTRSLIWIAAITLAWPASTHGQDALKPLASNAIPEGPSPRKNLSSQHWAFQPIIRPVTPTAHDSQWGRTAIDRFILAKLEQRGLSPSTPTAPRSLIRRLYLDLLGLPPTPDELAEFLTDRSENAYERLVDRVLASPRYGERWARHWLDVVRFAESHGFETNLARKNAWPYRDYVIRAFNEDKPYNQFIIEQLAGDALGAEEATGFIVAGPWDAVKSPDVNLTQQQRMDELHDMVATTGSAFLGLTVGCARCHHHKFDPISQTDYYAMQAVFAGVQHGDRILRPPDYQARTNQAEGLRQKVAALDAQAGEYEPLADSSFTEVPQMKVPNANFNVETFAPVAARFLRFTVYDTLEKAEPCIDELEVYAAPESSSNLALASAGAKVSASGTYPNSDLHKLEHLNDGKVGNSHSWISNEPGKGWVQIEFPQKILIHKIVWSRDREEKFKDRLPASYSIEAALTTNLWRTVAGKLPLRSPVHARRNVERFAAVQAKAVRFTVLAATSLEPCLDELEVYSAEESPRNVALAALGTIASASGNYPNDEQHKLEHVNDGQFGNHRSWISDQPGKGWVQLELPAETRINKIVWGRDREEKYSDRLATNYLVEVRTESGPWTIVATSKDREPYVANTKPKVTYALAGLSELELARLNELLTQKKALEKAIQELMAFPAIYAGKFQAPSSTHRLERGEPSAKREIVAPGALKQFKPQLELTEETPEQQRRLALAQWMVNPQNPLTARVLVNRLWHYHFGTGLVNTPSDFGLNGARPTHPELLDWLASEFIAQKWSIKALQRLILLSTTYQQSSTPKSKALALDGATQWLWRFPPRRIEAEALRDSILAVSGNLNLKMGGPGFDLFEPNDNYVKVYQPKTQFGPGEWRRMIYQAKPRMQLDDTFGAFDCPDAAQIAPKRTISTTPLQALNLLNSQFIMQQAGIFAERLKTEGQEGIRSQVRRGFLLAFGRPPEDTEATVAERFIDEHGLVAFCRALFNANEFVYLF